MNQQYDEELIINIIEAVENLGINGFHWDKKDEKFLNKQKELKKSIDKIIICLEWIDREYTLETYIKANGCRASQLQKIIGSNEEMEIPLGCVITALSYNCHRFRFLKINGWEDMLFFAPVDIVKELKSRKRIYDV
jgi:hypothetical protein